jgi:hypothetical protein
LWHVEVGELTVETKTGVAHLGQNARWSGSDDVVMATETSAAKVVLPSMAELQLAPQTRAQFQRPSEPSNAGTQLPRVHNEHIRLERGAVTLNVAHSPQPQSFTVTTTHALVVVRGTSFAVMIEQAPSRSANTRVVVQEGDVTVLSGGQEHRIEAGHEWASATEGSVVPSTPVAELADVTTAAPSAHTEPHKPSSELARQNQLFERAQAARRGGQYELALQRFVALMTGFPGSEHAHNARVEHFRLLRSLGRQAEARHSAQVYLRSYPRGFAAAEAERLAR